MNTARQAFQYLSGSKLNPDGPSHLHVYSPGLRGNTSAPEEAERLTTRGVTVGPGIRETCAESGVAKRRRLNYIFM